MKPIWGSQCLSSGPQKSLARGPQTGSTHWDTVATVSQLASWAMEARPEVALPTTDGRGRARGPAGKGCGEGSISAAFPIALSHFSAWSTEGVTTLCIVQTVTLLSMKRGVLLKTMWATGEALWTDCKSWV